MSGGRIQWGSQETLSQEAVFDVLQCQRRRFVLQYLCSEEARTELERLARQVTAWEEAVGHEAVTDRQHARTAAELRQVHLPMMVEAGFVAFDRDRGVVELTEAGAELRGYLHAGPDVGHPWSRFYLGLSLLGVGVLGAAVWNVVPFALLSPIGWTGVFVGLFGITACYHEIATRRTRPGTDGRPPG